MDIKQNNYYRSNTAKVNIFPGKDKWKTEENSCRFRLAVPNFTISDRNLREFSPL